jgi:hypothetical protein
MNDFRTDAIALSDGIGVLYIIVFLFNLKSDIKNKMSTNIKYCVLCFSFIIIVNSIFAQNKNERIYSFEPSYNRGGLFYNGFRLKSKESVYTNTFVLLNNVGFTFVLFY